MIGFKQVEPKDAGQLNSFAADPLGRDREKQPAQMPQEQFTDGDSPGDPEEDCSYTMG